MGDAPNQLAIGSFCISIMALVVVYRLWSSNRFLVSKISLMGDSLQSESIDEKISRLKIEEKEYREKIESNQGFFNKMEEYSNEFKQKSRALDVGITPPVFAFDDTEALKIVVKDLQEKQVKLGGEGGAVEGPTSWTIADDAEHGAALLEIYKRMVLRAYNEEFDMIRKQMRHSSLVSALNKLGRSEEQLNKILAPMEIYITYEYIQLKNRELKIWHRALMKKQEEKEKRKARRALLRDQGGDASDEEFEKLDDTLDEKSKDLALAQKLAMDLFDKERSKKEKEIAKIIKEIEALKEKRERATSQAQKTRAGYIYVISNIGSFGEGVLKIGMTRRLEPMDRVNELGDASVPFKFDVHTLVFVDDAPAIERLLHSTFNDRRVNVENHRKEFFKVPIREVEEKMREIGIFADWFYEVEARDYRESQLIREANQIQRMKTLDVLDSLPASL